MPDWFLVLLGICLGLMLIAVVMWVALTTAARGWGRSWFSRPSQREDTGISVGTPSGQIGEWGQTDVG